MEYQNVIDFLVKFKAFGPFVFAFLIGFAMGLFDFARNFSNDIKSIICSLPGLAYCAINGLAVVSALWIIKTLNIQILSFNFNDNKCMIALIVGVVGYISIFAKISNHNNSDREITGIFIKTLSQIQKMFFDRYTLSREVELRPQISKIMKDVDNDMIIMISDSCTAISRNLDTKRSAELADRLLKIHSSEMPIGIKKIEMGLEHVKNIGIEYFKQIINEFNESSSIGKSIKNVDEMIKELQRINEEEKENG